MGKRTAQKDTIIDITSDSQVNSNFPYRWSPASLTFNNYFYLFLYLYITWITINNNAPHLKSPKNQNRKAALGRPAIIITQLAKVYRATSGPTHYSIAARWWLPSTALWRGCNSADDGSDVALTPTDRRRPANGSTYGTICSLTSSLFHIDLFVT